MIKVVGVKCVVEGNSNIVRLGEKVRRSEITHSSSVTNWQNARTNG